MTDSRKAATDSAVVVVTGLSGAGKSTALNALEDLGFFCIDNLPPPVLKDTLDELGLAGVRRIALGIDVRVRRFLTGAAPAIEGLSSPERKLSVLFLDAADEAILRRFSSTRRPHPLSTEASAQGASRSLAVLDGVRIERELLTPLRAQASLILDTTRQSVNDLRLSILSHFGTKGGERSRMSIRFLSFGHKHGAPVDADMMLDVRFLKNPYFVPELRPLSGVDRAVRDFVLETDEAKGFLERAEALVEFCLPRFEREGKSYVTVAIGCTGGRHRSVAIAEHLAKRARDALGVQIDVVHRDLRHADLDEPAGAPDRPSGGSLSQGGSA